MKKLILLTMMALTLPACSQKQEDLKSPCVGTDDSPCVRRPVNEWWTNHDHG